MKFLIDAQLPVRLSLFLQTAGYDTIHTRDLPQQNATPDTEVNTISIQESRIVITKDSDFLDSFLRSLETGFLQKSFKETRFLSTHPLAPLALWERGWG
jgi:predicted nuclease of predicted toxin-antitoxin system